MVSLTVFLSALATVSAFAPATRIAPRTSVAMQMAKKPPPVTLKYLDAIAVADLPQPGSAKTVTVAGLKVCIAVAEDGLVYALAGKAPPAGWDFNGAKVSKSTIKDFFFGTEFSLSTGEVVGKWCPGGIGLPGIGLPVFGFLVSSFIKPCGVATYKVKKTAKMIQVEVDVNYKAAYESNYWRGILDAQGKTDGGYY